MRAYHAIAVVAALLISFGVKMFVSSSPPTAEADIQAVPSASMNDLAPYGTCRIQNPTLPGVSVSCFE
jgi:hypothetical protein